ncbi:unnamed protein product [Owenia fusiformis]|uniref:Uncharacterized protein n=1 Tax=Owenia fusiformis TaxID=6347 RepID=A0A8S4PXR3_OWEFU|nr:unnamed protein product [Owenia fusiformis]
MECLEKEIGNNTSKCNVHMSPNITFYLEINENNEKKAKKQILGDIWERGARTIPLPPLATGLPRTDSKKIVTTNKAFACKMSPPAICYTRRSSFDKFGQNVSTL